MIWKNVIPERIVKAFKDSNTLEKKKVPPSNCVENEENEETAAPDKHSFSNACFEEEETQKIEEADEVSEVKIVGACTKTKNDGEDIEEPDEVLEVKTVESCTDTKENDGEVGQEEGKCSRTASFCSSVVSVWDDVSIRSVPSVGTPKNRVGRRFPSLKQIRPIKDRMKVSYLDEGIKEGRCGITMEFSGAGSMTQV